MKTALIFALSMLAMQSDCPDNTQSSKPEAPKVLLDRYELHDVYNGPFHGTALLDKQTGRIWTMGTSTGKDGKIDEVDFSAAGVIPQPQP